MCDACTDARCAYCGEPLHAARHGIMTASGLSYHRECFHRLCFGSIAHHMGECSCFIPGSTLTDPPGLSLHEAALLAFEFSAPEVTDAS